ncbi:uncharacterized protein LOC111058210 [Nilaparvata lugens]|uniref:uncharacterized protein LOC111058210 n=1 Tax=Nilaparvata lugens TaxID=108931 RepID=UPI00193E5D17|nr:uncharacterized protein LOC111058210 [Nilaparvata lugens]XP_039295944.1 uncharacterized protein LOC111058210 [Nilaparvata lugens]
MEQRGEHGTIYLHAVLYFVTLVSGNTEHKVHNIVLYPDKHSWCKTTAIEQVITHPGCEPLTLPNNVCVGACFSYSIPRTLPAAPGDVLPYCDSCQPSTSALHHVTLKCKREGGGDDGEESETMNKVVEVITNCSCMTCSDAASRQLPADAVADDDDDAVERERDRDVPQLLSLMQRRPSLSDAHTSPATNTSHIIKHKLLSLLTELNSGVEELSEASQVTLRELLGQVEGQHHQVDDATLQSLVEKVQKEEHINIDINQLKHILHKFESSEKQKLATEHNLNAHRHQHVHGPHHSLVYGQNVHHDRIHSGMVLAPTLDVESHHLKPALAGSELSYHDNLVQAESEHQHTSEKPTDDHHVQL